MKKLKDILFESFNRKLTEQQDINIGGYADPGHTYSYDATNQTILKKNSAGKTVATYKKENNAWKWIEGNRQLSNNLSVVFNKAIGNVSNSTQTSSADQTTTTNTQTSPVTNILTNWDSAQDVNLPVRGNIVAVSGNNSAELESVTRSIKGIVDGFVNSLDDLAVITVQNTTDIQRAITSLYKINIRRADFKNQTKVPGNNVQYYVVRDNRELIPLFSIINILYKIDEGISLIDDLNKLVRNELSSAQREQPQYKKNIEFIKKLLPLIKI